MRHSVRFLSQRKFWRAPEFGCFLGKGQLQLQENGLIVDGRKLRVRLPLIDTFYQAIISSPCVRTIPYSAITSHQPERPWGLWLAAAVVGIFSALFLVVPDSWPSKGAAVFSLVAIVLALLAAKPKYYIQVRNTHGRIDRLRFGVRSRVQRRVLAEDLDRHIGAVKELMRKPTTPATPATQKRQAKTTPLTIPSPLPRSPTTKARWVDALRSAWVWGCAGLLSALVIHAVFSSMPRWLTIATTPLAARAEALFYGLGRQIHALIWGVTPESVPNTPALFRADGATLTTIFLVTIAGCLVGVFFALSQPKNFVACKKTVPKVAIWLPLLATLSFTGWLAYSLTRTSIANTAPEVEKAAVQSEVLGIEADEELVIMFDNTRLQTFGVTFAEMRQALSRQNVETVEELPHQGSLRFSKVWVVRNIGKVEGLGQLADLVVKEHDNGQLAYVRDIAIVEVRKKLPSESRPEPLSAVAKMSIGQQLDKQGRYEIARGNYDKAIRLFADANQNQLPEKAICYSDSAANLLALHRWGEAQAHANAALAILEEGFPNETLQDANRQTKKKAIRLAQSQSWYWGLVILFAAIVAWNAGRLGFSSWLWLAITTCCGFPLAMLPVLGSLPDPRLEQRRLDLHQLLNADYVGPTSKPASRHVTDHSLGDQTTQDPA